MSRRPLVPGQYLHIYALPGARCILRAVAVSQSPAIHRAPAPGTGRDPCVISAEISGAAVNKTNILPDPDCRLSN